MMRSVGEIERGPARITRKYRGDSGDVGQMPALTIPIAMVGGIIFALLPLAPARTRLNVLLAGAALGFVLDTLMAR